MPPSYSAVPVLSYLGKPTFAGVLMLYWHEISTGWNENTDQQYRHLYYDCIIPSLPGHDTKSVDMVSMEDYRHGIQVIQRNGYQLRNSRKNYAEMTVEKLWYLIRLVVETGARHYLCKNIFSESKVKRVRTQNSDEKVILRRSLTSMQQILAENLLLTDPLQTGAKMGLALMLTLGLRDAEACGLNFSDIRPMKGHKDIYFAWIYKSTQVGSNRQQASGKTRNADRLIPVPKRLLSLIEARRMHLLSLGYDPSQMPIACRKDDYLNRCAADNLTEAAHPFFAELGITYEQMNCINNLIQKAYTESVYGPEVCEKNPTAYLLRRNFATKLSYRGLNRSEICYVIGHDIEDPAESRNEFMADEKLLKIWEKMIGSSAGKCEQLQIKAQSVCSFEGGSFRLRLPENCQKVSLHLNAQEPMESIYLKISGADEQRIFQELLCFQKKISYTNTVNLSKIVLDSEGSCRE